MRELDHLAEEWPAVLAAVLGHEEQEFGTGDAQSLEALLILGSNWAET